VDGKPIRKKVEIKMSILKANEVDKIKAVLRRIGSPNVNGSLQAQAELVQALQVPIRQGVTDGNIISQIFTTEVFDAGVATEYPIHFYRQDNAADHVAYTIPAQGRIPQRQVQGDSVTVPTYDVGNAIDILLRYAKEARWDVVSALLEVFRGGIIKKLNDDGWHTILQAAVDRNVMVNDSAASQGQFTKRLVSLMKLVMRRNAGGNSMSTNRGKMTHLFISPEGLEDMRSWDVDEVDDVTRREIFVAGDGEYSKIFGVNLVDLDELGVDQEYQNYAEDVLGASVAGSDNQFVIGLDLENRDSFVQPIREELTITEDAYLHRERKWGIYGWMGTGFGVLNNARVLLGSM
jgi:hypothetical protein